MRPTAFGIACFGCALLVAADPLVAFGQDMPAQAEAAPAAPIPGKSPARRPSKSAGRGKQAGSAGSVVPGFETLADGSTRLFVELSQAVKYEAKSASEAKSANAVFTCVLKGAHVDRRNNYNPLVTVDFNTPVTSARLVPHGADLWLVAVLRAKVSPTVTMDATKEGGAMLRVEFPKGDYVRVIQPVAAPASASGSSNDTEATPDDTDAPPSTH